MIRVDTSKVLVSKKCISLLAIMLFSGCLPNVVPMELNKELPADYGAPQDIASATDTVSLKWNNYFDDKNLIALIETALANNQEMNIFLQEIEISKNEVRARSGAYIPSVEIGSGAGIDKVGKYTRNGSVEENLNIEEGRGFPDPLSNFTLGAHASWEVDIWSKLRDAQKSALMSYLATTEGRNLMVTNLIAEIASSYFELLAFDSQLDIVIKNIELQSNALEIVKLKKQGARVTELAVRRFEAQLLHNKGLRYEIQQKIVEAENRLNYLLGRYPQHIVRNYKEFGSLLSKSVKAGIPSQLIENRPDLRQAEFELQAAELDVGVAKANFYPSLHISGDIGYEAYKTSKLVQSPESLLYSLGAGLTAPLFNRREIEAMYKNANAKQIQAVLNYQKVLLNAVVEVTNYLSSIDNLENAYKLKEQQVQALSESVDISITLFNSARADYMEVLLTQRDAIESRFELVDVTLRRLQATVGVYRALGGGWRKE